MVLTEKVSFTAVLQKGNRFQVPKVLRWRFKMDNEQVLKVSVSVWKSSAPGTFFTLEWIGVDG